MEITSQSKLFDVLEAYPQLEEQIIHIAPPFKNLKNPVLRRTVGRLATLAQVAQVGGMDTDRLVNTLRRAVGQQELGPQTQTRLEVAIPRAADDPDWVAGEPQFTVDGTHMLERGEVPLARVNQLLPQLAPDRYLLLVTSFEPAPILDVMQKQGRAVYYKMAGEGSTQHLTFIR